MQNKLKELWIESNFELLDGPTFPKICFSRTSHRGIVLDPSKRKRPSEFSVVCTIVQVLTIPDISKTLVGRKTLKK
jgi:hypothetical protein